MSAVGGALVGLGTLGLPGETPIRFRVWTDADDAGECQSGVSTRVSPGSGCECEEALERVAALTTEVRIEEW